MLKWKEQTLAKRLKELREERSLSQKDIAQYIGVSDRVYAYYEDGRFPKNEDTLIKLSLLHNVTVDYLLGKSNSKTGSNDNMLRATGLDDESLNILSRNIEDKDTLNALLQHDNFPLMVNLLSLYVKADQHRILSHIGNSSDKLPLNEQEKTVLTVYHSSSVTDADKDNDRLPPATSAAINLYLQMIVQYQPLEPFLFSVLDNCLNDILKQLKKQNENDRLFPKAGN